MRDTEITRDGIQVSASNHFMNGGVELALQSGLVIHLGADEARQVAYGILLLCGEAPSEPN